MNYFSMITSRRAFKRLRVVVVTAALVMMGSAHGGGADASRLDSLMETIHQQAAQLEALRQEVEHLKAKTAAADSHAKAQKKHGVVVYGSIRPSLTYSDDGDDTSTDVTDFLSRVGIKGHVDIAEGLTAFYRGEWDTDIEADGDLGDARLGYVGLKTGLGQIAIGKQWDPHFNLTAEVTDIYNHRASPFGYDNVGPFRTNNLVTYVAHMGGLTLQAGARFDGKSDNGEANYDSSGNASEPDDADAGSVGISYRMGPMYAAVSYLEQHGKDDYERSFTGFGASMNATENLYLAVTYQDIEVDNHIHNGMFEDHDQDSLDLAVALALGGGYKLKTSYFDWDDDDQGGGFDGYNLTIERQINDTLRIHAEYLQRDYEMSGKDTADHFSLGLRYDFEAEL